MQCINIIDNIDKGPEAWTDISAPLASQICDLIIENMRFENGKSCYSQADLQHLLSNKRPSLIRERLRNGILVYLTDKNNQLVGCGMVESKGSRFEAKTLHISSEFRGKGYAQLICDIRENILRKHGIREIFTESLQFENTVRFHTSRGFKPYNDGKCRKYSIFMRKDL